MVLFEVDGRYTKKHTFPPLWIYFALFHYLLLFLSVFQLSHQIDENERNSKLPKLYLPSTSNKTI
jgi:hypothetical protein